jgi:peroxiredoxin
MSLLSLVLLTSTGFAGKYNPTLSIGDQSPTWTKLPGTDGKQHSFDDLKDKDVLVVFFTCNSCEYAIDYEDRIIATAKKAKAEKKQFPFAYLFDETQKIAKDFGGSTTPEFFVINQERKIVYMGSLDDNPDAAKAKENYVHKAIAAALEGKAPATTETVPIGCLIRYDRRRMRMK